MGRRCDDLDRASGDLCGLGRCRNSASTTVRIRAGREPRSGCQHDRPDPLLGAPTLGLGTCGLGHGLSDRLGRPGRSACRSNPEGSAAGLDQPTRLGGGASRPERRQWAFVVGSGSKSAIRDVHTGSPSRSTVAIPRRSESRLSVRGGVPPRRLVPGCSLTSVPRVHRSCRRVLSRRSPGWSGQTRPTPSLFW